MEIAKGLTPSSLSSRVSRAEMIFGMWTITFEGLFPLERMSSRSAEETKKNLGKATILEYMNSFKAFSQMVRSSWIFSSPGRTYG